MRRLLLLLLMLASGLPAAAHTLLNASEPPDGANLSQPVRDIRLVFAEPVTPVAMRMLQPDGAIVRLNDIVSDHNIVRIRLPESSQTGTNILSWRVMSGDGHPVGGTVTFSVNAGGAAPADASALASRTYRLALWSSGLLRTVCLTIAVGGGFFRAWFMSAASRRLAALTIGAAVLGLLAETAGVVIQTLDATGDPATALRAADLWWTMAMTPYGSAAWLTTGALLAALGASVCPWGVVRRAVSLLALACACAAFLVTGHVSQATPHLLVYPGMLFHVAGMLIWFGALLPLLAALRWNSTEAARLLARFSRPVLVITIILPLTGLVLAVLELQSVAELWGSAYGIVLLIKLALLVPLFGLGAVNRFALTPAVLRGAASGRRWLARSVAGEVGLAVLVLGVVGLWRFTPPPREMASVQVTATGLQLHAHGIAAMVNLTFSPARVGMVKIRLSVLNLDATFLNARAVDVALFRPDGSPEPIRRTARRGGGATWDVDDVDVGIPGRWLVRIDVAMPDNDRVYARTSIDLAER